MRLVARCAYDFCAHFFDADRGAFAGMGGFAGGGIPNAARASVSGGARAGAPAPGGTLTRVDYDLRIDGGAASGGELASGRATLTIDVLKDGWVRVPIPAGLLVREARLDGKLVSLVSDGSGSGKGGGQLSAL